MAKQTKATSGARTREKITALERLADRKAIVEIKRKLAAGEHPTHRELRQWKRWATSDDNETLAAVLLKCPHKVLRELAGGRSSQSIHNLDDKYGIPMRGPTVDLFVVVKALVDWVVDNGQKVKRLKDADSEDVGGENSPALERLRAAKALREEFAYERDQELWIRRTEVHDGFSLFSGIMRRAGERLQKQFGRDAHKILDEAVVDAGDVLRRRFESAAEGNGRDE